MAKSGRGQTRRDSKNRVLRPGESVRANGKYQYKYHIDGKPHFVYSWKLEPTDKLPKGKKPCLSLRELEKQINTELGGAVKHRGWTDDSLRTGRQISKNQDRRQRKYQARICNSSATPCKRKIRFTENQKRKDF